MPEARITLDTLRRMRRDAEPFAMLTAYDHPTAALAQEAGVHSLLVGDSMATVLLGHENTRRAPFDVMVVLAEAVRRGAPQVFLVGDLPFEAMKDPARSARRFADEAGCDAVKFEAGPDAPDVTRAIRHAGVDVIVHLGLRPQSVLTPDGYRAQARDEDAIAQLVTHARSAADAGAAMILLEAVPNEASAAVVAAVDVPVIGCGAGPACHGHVVVTQDMLGLGTIRPPRFVPVLSDVGPQTLRAMRRYVADIRSGAYPAAEHVYGMKAAPAGAPSTSCGG